jgi:hypothetical protein
MNVSKILMANAQPEVVLAGVATALMPGREGVKDREMQFKMGGLLQDSPLVNLNIGQTQGIGKQEDFMRDVLDVQPIDVGQEEDGDQ